MHGIRVTLIRDYLAAVEATLRYLVPIPLAIYVAYLIFSCLLTLPQPWRTLTIWTEIGLLCVGSVAGDPHRRR